MIMEFAAAVMLMGADASSKTLCVQSKYDDGNHMIFGVPADQFGAFSRKAQSKNRNFTVVACPSGWTAAHSRKLCDKIEEFSDDLKAAMTEIYAISPDEMCDASREADSVRAKAG